MRFESEIDQSVRYLGSDAAARALAADAYWPKWHAPWWHMLLLHEMGHTSLIPEKTVEQLVAALNRIPVKIFPIHPGDLPRHRSFPRYAVPLPAWHRLPGARDAGRG